jgi:hypothetical protein
MLHRFIVAIGAGFAAALLFAVSSQSSLLAMALFYLAPLPIMIATLGWGLDAGAIAGAISVAALAVFAALALLAEPEEPLLSVVFMAPSAWALAAFAITPIAKYFRWRRSDAPVHPSVGAVVMLAAFIGMIAAAAVLSAVIVVYGGYAEGARQAASAVVARAFDGAPNQLVARDLADALVRFGPSAIAASMLIMLCVNLYAAARSTLLSHNLPRSWPDLPTSLFLPWPLGIAFLACLAAFFSLPAPAAQYFSIGAGGLGVALALQGLAVAHALSRGLKMRLLMLVALYACCVFRAEFTLPALAALGVLDGFLRLRSRAALIPTPTPTGQK